MKLNFLITALAVFMTVFANAQKEYENNWESLKNYEAPEWYEDAKLGFWPIWGVYSVPAYMGKHAAEWYGRWMYCHEGQERDYLGPGMVYNYHKDKYGDPSVFGYKELIPLFTAEKFNPIEWVDLCETMGAKYFCTLGLFSDGFNMGQSKLSKWNAAEMGPHRDIVGELGNEVRKRGLKYGVSNHFGFNPLFYMFNHINGYDAKDPENSDLYGSPIVASWADTLQYIPGESRESWLSRLGPAVKHSEADLNRWLARTKEMAEIYKPDLYYFDWGQNVPVFESRRRDFASFFYNNAIESGFGVFGKPNVVINYKSLNTYATGSAVRDFEHGAFEDIHNMVWQTDESIYYGNNWGYAEGIKIKPVNMIVDQLVDVVSKRGVLMLAVAPKADGTFPEDQKEFMRELGGWLKICGEAVYATRPYEVFGELGNKWLERDEHGHKKYLTTNEDIRFTRNKSNTVLFAISLEWPGEKMKIKTLANADLSQIKSIKLLGTKTELKWKQTDEALEIDMPQMPSYDFAYPVKIEFKSKLPVLR